MISLDWQSYGFKCKKSYISLFQQGEEARQKKFRKKLEQQVKSGKITEAEAEEKLEKFGRPKQEETESPSFTLLNSDRGLRKRQQVENIASVLLENFRQICSSSLSQKKPFIVDFGCGSGNLCLALAAAFPETTFLLTDRFKLVFMSK